MQNLYHKLSILTLHFGLLCLILILINTVLPSCLILKQGMKHPIEPLKSFLNSSKLLENLSPSIILSSPTLPQLLSTLTIPPSPPLLPLSPSPFFPTLSWQGIHHPHYPHQLQDLLWKISHF